MRAYLHVTETSATMHLPRTSNRTADTIDQGRLGISPGWYRAKAVWFGTNWRGKWHCEPGSKVNHKAEAKRLEQLASAKRGLTARTSSPGIAGYLEAERAATGAMQTNVQINEYFAQLLVHA